MAFQLWNRVIKGAYAFVEWIQDAFKLFFHMIQPFIDIVVKFDFVQSNI